MQRKVIDIIAKETIRLINEQKDSIFLPLIKTPDLFTREEIKHNFSCQQISYWADVMNDEAYKVKRLEVTFVVVGTMKSGKSTTINAIVGNELLPNRNGPMTILPTIIRHCPQKTQPELIFANPQPLNDLLQALRQKLKAMENTNDLEQISINATSDGKALIQKIVDGSFGEIKQSYQGREDIFALLTYVNDIWRLCKAIALDPEVYFNQFQKAQDLPVLATEFFHLRNLSFEGSFALVDTPGPNEAGQFFLKNVMADQLQKASAAILILDYTQINAQAEAQIRKSLKLVARSIRSSLFVLINKFDQRDRNGMNMESLRSYVARLFEGAISETRVFPVSSKYAYLANRALGEIAQHKSLSDLLPSPWIADFGQLALGACWERELSDSEEVERRAIKLWEYSQFEHPLAQIIKNGSENAALMSLKSAISKMLEYDKKILQSLELRINALAVDINVIENQIDLIGEDIGTVKAVQENLEAAIRQHIYNLRQKFSELVAGNIACLKEEIQIGLNLNNYEDFTNEQEARALLEALSELLAKKLATIEEQAIKEVDVVLISIRTNIIKALESVLKSVSQRIAAAFAVTLAIPHPKLMVDLDSAGILSAVIKREKVTKVATILERRWYTLWSHEHKRQYQYKVPVYRIYIMDILEIVQKAFTEDSGGIWQSLDKYVQTEFKAAINLFLADGFNYLESIQGDLLESLHNQELKSEHLAELQKAMNTIHKTAIAHCRDVELLGRGLLIKGRKEAV